jgi:hypothetical protein
MNIIEAIQRTGRPAAVVFALVAFASAAHSQQTSVTAIATAKELVAATRATTVFNPLIAGVIEQAKLLFLQQDPGLAKDLNEIADKMRTDLAPRFADINDEMAKLYATHFTDQELKAILAFYKTPVGQKLLTEQPTVVDASMRYAQDWANKLSDQVIAKMREELKKRGHNL